MDTLDRYFRRNRLVFVIIGFLGLIAFVAGLKADPQRAWGCLMVGNLYFITLAVGAAVFVAFASAFGAGWPVVFRRIPEAMTAYLPIGGVILVATFLGGGAYLYPWMRPATVATDAMLRHKQAFLNPGVYLAVSVAAFALWIGFSVFTRRLSRKQDVDGEVAHTRTQQRASAGFLVLFGITIVFASIAWIMSLQPHWTSTMFPVYVLAGILSGGVAAIALLVTSFQKQGIFTNITSHHRYELARLVSACCAFWVYVWFSQYMLIYYTNIPEEAKYYAIRWGGTGWTLVLLNVVANWVAPTLLLLTDKARRSAGALAGVCLLVLAGHYLDILLMVMPALKSPMRLGLFEVLIPLGFLPLFAFPFLAAFRAGNPVPARDPYLVESVHLTV